MQIASSLMLAAGLAMAVVTPALADPPIPAGKLTDTRVERAPTTQATPRDNNVGGEFVTMRDELENFPLDTSFGGEGVSAPPASFIGPPGFVWPLNNLRGQTNTNFVRLVDLSGAPVGGSNGVINATRAIEIVTGTAQPPGGFFTGANLRFGGQSGEPTLPLAPTADHKARVSAEYYLSTIEQTFTFERGVAINGGAFTTGRLLWGGVCTEDAPGDCTDIGIPIGLNPHILTLTPTPASFTPLFFPARYCINLSSGNPIPGCVPPVSAAIGDLVTPPIGEWCKFVSESTQDGRLRYFLDVFNGSGEFLIVDQPILVSPYIDRVSSNTSFESQDAFLLVDNIEASGHLLAMPKAPELECPYLDDIEWLETGPLHNQNPRWEAAMTSAATVINDGVRGQIIRQVNDVSSDNRFREEMRTLLPDSYSLDGFPWTLCFEAATTTGLSGNTTARAFSIDSEATDHILGGVTMRIYLGITDPDTGIADSTIYIQTNPEYDPTDDPSGNDPFENAPVVGVDIVSTGVEWPADDRFRQICVTVDNDGEMRITLNGVYILWGGEAFGIAASILRIESENNATGAGARLDFDDLEFDCHPLPQVFVPELLTPFLDRMDWAVNNVPPKRHIDDPVNSPYESTRFTHVDGALAREHPDYDGWVLIPNRLRNTTHIAPPDYNQSAPFIFTQFAMVVPSIAGDAGTSWRVEATFAMTDFLTSWGIAPGQLSDVGDAHEPVGYLWISAVDQKVYLFASPENAGSEDDILTIDTGYNLAQLSVEPGEPVVVIVWHNRATGLIEWLMNGVHLGATFPIVGTDNAGNDHVHKDLDALLFLGGNDLIAAPTEESSSMALYGVHIMRRTDCGDANGDEQVNYHDLNAVLSNYGATDLPSSGFNPGDANGDGSVDFADLNAVLAAFGTSCE